MDKVTGFRIRGLTLSGFKCFDARQSFAFGGLTMITGANHVGKSSIADAIAFAFTGTTFYGEGRIDRLYNEQNPDIEVRVTLEDAAGASHELVRSRKKDRMSISYDDYNIRQQDLTDLFGERDVFLSIFNPLYFIEKMGDGGKALLEKHLPFVPQEAAMEGMSEFNKRLLSGKDILAPENYMKELRADIRESKENIIALEGQASLLMTQRWETAQALNLLKVTLGALEPEIAALEAKKTGGASALQAKLDEAVARENEILSDKPALPATAGQEQELRDCELALERTRAKAYGSKFTQAIADTTAALNAAYAEHKRISALAAHVKPGTKCPVCFTGLTEQHLESVKKELAPQLSEIVTRGVGLKSQLADLKELDKKALEAFEQFQKEDAAKHTARISQLRQSLEAAKQSYAAEVESHQAALRQARAATQELQEQIALCGLTQEESDRLAALQKQQQQAQADFDAQQAVYRGQTDTTKEKIAEIEAQIKSKELLLAAVADYASRRAEMTFEKLSAGEVRVRLFEVFKTTGEVKDCFKFTYQGRDYKRLSRSEKLLAGVSVAELIKQLTGRNYPMFIDDSESVAGIPRPTGQTFLARVVPNAPLCVKEFSEPDRPQVSKAA